MMKGIQYNVQKLSKKYLNKLGIHRYDRVLMVPRMTTKEYLFFIAFLKKNAAATYFESGSGGSTLMAEKIFSEMHSFETDAGFVAYMNGLLQKVEVSLIPVGSTGKFGYPKEQSSDNAQCIAQVFNTLLNDKNTTPRLVFLDGRSRVLTALEIHGYLMANDTVLIHDFKRKHYQDVLQAYTIVAQAEGLVVLQKKTVLPKQLNNLKQQYSSDLR